MEDKELEEIKNQRLQQLHQLHNVHGGYRNLQNEEVRKQKEAALEKQEEYRNIILSQILTQEARARLNIIKVAKPENARIIENFLINDAKMNIMKNKLSEDDLKKILEKFKLNTKETKISFERKRVNFDSDDDE